MPDLRTSLLVEELFDPALIGGVGRLLAESCALELLARALQTNEPGDDALTGRVSPQDQARILLVRDRLLAEPEAHHTLGDLAREAGLSVSALKAKFPLVVGQSVFAFLRDVRLQRAHDGIVREGWSIGQAAYFTGYRHQSNFSAAFRRKFGVPPSDLRRQ